MFARVVQRRIAPRVARGGSVSRPSIVHTRTFTATDRPTARAAIAARAARRQTRAPPPPRHMFAVSSTRVVVNAANTSGTKRVAGKKAAAGKVRTRARGFILKPSRPRPRSRPRGARGGARDARSTRARDARDRRARAIDRPRGRARDAAIGERTATRRSIDRATSGGRVDAGSRTVDREIGAREETEGETKANANARLTDDATRATHATQPGQKKGFFDWLLEKSVRDSGVIGAGYEDDLKSGQYKPKGGLNISEGGSFKI